MKKNIKKAIEEYQCPGCVCGMDISCYEKAIEHEDIRCKKHVAGIMLYPIVGSIFLGMPKGFNRLGPRLEKEQFNLNIFETLNDGWGFDIFNIPVWKFKDKHGNTLVRGLRPRLNDPFLYIFLEDCINKIYCYEITDKDIMD